MPLGRWVHNCIESQDSPADLEELAFHRTEPGRRHRPLGNSGSLDRQERRRHWRTLPRRHCYICSHRRHTLDRPPVDRYILVSPHIALACILDLGGNHCHRGTLQVEHLRRVLRHIPARRYMLDPHRTHYCRRRHTSRNMHYCTVHRAYMMGLVGTHRQRCTVDLGRILRCPCKRAHNCRHHREFLEHRRTVGRPWRYRPTRHLDRYTYCNPPCVGRHLGRLVVDHNDTADYVPSPHSVRTRLHFEDSHHRHRRRWVGGTYHRFNAIFPPPLPQDAMQAANISSTEAKHSSRAWPSRSTHLVSARHAQPTILFTPGGGGGSRIDRRPSARIVIISLTGHVRSAAIGAAIHRSLTTLVGTTRCGGQRDNYPGPDMLGMRILGPPGQSAAQCSRSSGQAAGSHAPTLHSHAPASVCLQASSGRVPSGQGPRLGSSPHSRSSSHRASSHGRHRGSGHPAGMSKLRLSHRAAQTSSGSGHSRSSQRSTRQPQTPSRPRSHATPGLEPSGQGATSTGSHSSSRQSSMQARFVQRHVRSSPQKHSLQPSSASFCEPGSQPSGRQSSGATQAPVKQPPRTSATVPSGH